MAGGVSEGKIPLEQDTGTLTLFSTVLLYPTSPTTLQRGNLTLPAHLGHETIFRGKKLHKLMHSCGVNGKLAFISTGFLPSVKKKKNKKHKS